MLNYNKESKRRNHFTLFDMLSMGAGLLICSGFVLASQNTLGVFTSWMIGLPAGFLLFMLTRKIAKWSIRTLKINEPGLSAYRMIFSWGLCVALIAWDVASGYIGYNIISFLRFLRKI